MYAYKNRNLSTENGETRKTTLFRSVVLTFLDRNLQPAVLVVHHGRYVGNYKQPQYRHQDRQPQTKVLAVDV